MDDQEAYLRDEEARTQAYVQRAQQRIRELERLSTETAAESEQNRHKIETVMRDFDRMAQAQGYAGAFDDGARDDGARGPHHKNAPALRRYVDPAPVPAAAPAPAAAPVPAAAVLAAITPINPDKYNIRL